MSNYQGCKEETINLIPRNLIDIIRKTVKPSHLEKLKIIQNINKLILIKQIIAKTLYREDLSNITFNYLCENSPNYLCHF